MLPVLDREVVEAEQGVAILDQALNRLVVFDAPGLDEGVEGGKPIVLVSPIRFPAAHAWLSVAGCSAVVEDVGDLVHPAALEARLGQTSFTVCQNPSSPSADTSLGPIDSPRLFR